jgi:hypothetical protein
MKTLNTIAANPSGLDSYSNYVGETPSDSLLVVLTRSRDCDTLTESNWEVALERLGGESDTVEIHRFGHWVCGWWEALAVEKGSEAEKEALEIESELEGYPVLNEDHWSELQENEAARVWSDCFSIEDRIEHLRTEGGAVFNGLGDLLQCVRGVFPPYGNDGYYGILGE